MIDGFQPQVRVTGSTGNPDVSFLPTAYRSPDTQDSVPSPYAHLLAGLGACTIMTLRMYAGRQAWPLATVRVDLQHKKVPIPETTEKSDHFTRVIELSGSLTDEQKTKLLQIAEKCPISRTLMQGCQIVSHLT
jgi:putative redox protein